MPDERGPIPSKGFVEAAIGSAKEASGKAADIARQLALAGIAVVWIFREVVPGGSMLPEGLRVGLILLVATLGLDFLQYVAEFVGWDFSNYVRLERFERGARDRLLSFFWRRQHLSGDEYIIESRPASFLFWAKVVTISVAYVLLLKFMLERTQFA